MRVAISLTAGLVLSVCNVARAQIFYFGGHTYEIVTAPLTWHAAAAAAASSVQHGVNGYLAIINSGAENTAVFNALSAANITTASADGGNGVYAWLGATDEATEGVWLDVLGDPLVYDNFAKNGNLPPGSPIQEPDNSGGSQHYAGMGLSSWPVSIFIPPGSYIGQPGEWNDLSAASSLAYVVEYNAVPEPAQSAALTALALGVAAVFRRVRSFRRANR